MTGTTEKTADPPRAGNSGNTGFWYPRTASGRASLLPNPPWHYSGELLTLEYRTDPAAVAELLPAPLTLADDDPGAVAVIFADWQSCGPDFSELLDPSRSQYKEVFVVVRCQYRSETYSRCAYIWVDKDFAIARGQHQGYPKKLGEVWMTRPVTVGRAGPRLAPGGRFGATVSTHGRRLIEAEFTITGPSETNGFVNALPMLHHRQMPSIEGLAHPLALDEIVTMRGFDFDPGPIFTGTVDRLWFGEAPTEELTRIAPRETIAGYWRTVGTSWQEGTTLHTTSLRSTSLRTGAGES